MTPFEADLVALMPGLRVFAFRLSQDNTKADDLAQDTLAKALRFRNAYAPGTNMRAWLYQIAKNLWIDERRRAWRTTELEPEMLDGMAVQPVAPIRIELAEALEVFNRLPDQRMREAMTAICFDGEGYAETAQAHGCPIGTIKSLISRGRAEMREQLS